MEPKVLVFAGNCPVLNADAFGRLVVSSRAFMIGAEIVGVACDPSYTELKKAAENLAVPVTEFSAPHTEQAYRDIVEKSGANFVLLYGWAMPVHGLDPKTTIRIHPAPVDESGMLDGHGMDLQDQVKRACESDQISHSGISANFVSGENGQGPMFFETVVFVEASDTVVTLTNRVREKVLQNQAGIVDMVVTGDVHWDGVNISTLVN